MKEVQQKDSSGWTALHVAVNTLCVDIAKYLFIRSIEGITLEYQAAQTYDRTVEQRNWKNWFVATIGQLPPVLSVVDDKNRSLSDVVGQREFENVRYELLEENRKEMIALVPYFSRR